MGTEMEMAVGKSLPELGVRDASGLSTAPDRKALRDGGDVAPFVEHFKLSAFSMSKLIVGP
jgi:hypothetical protein